MARRLLYGLAIVLAVVAAWGVVAGFVLPRVLPESIAAKLAHLTGRPVSIERIEIRPYAMVLALRGLRIGEQGNDAEPGGRRALRSHLRLAVLEADFSWRSLRRLAPVLEHLRIEQPQVFVARKVDGSYDGADIVERLSDEPKGQSKPGAPPAFSIANIELTGGRLELDDRKLNLSHVAEDIGLRIPFASSLPVDQMIEVEPGLDLRLDGAPIRMTGRMLPFAAERTGEIRLSVEAFDLTRWLPYLREALPVKVVSATLASELTASFVAPESAPAKLLIQGSGALTDIELRQPDDRALLKLAALHAEGVDFEPLASRLAIEKLDLSKALVSVERRAGEVRFLEPVMSALEKDSADRSSNRSKTPGGALAERPASLPHGFDWSIGTVVVDQGALAFDDQSFKPKPLHVDLGNVAIEAKGLSSAQLEPAQLKLSATGGKGESLSANARLKLSPLSVAGEASLGAVSMADWAWLAGSQLALKVHEGKLSLSSRFEVDQSGDHAPLGWKLSDGTLHIDGLGVRDTKREVLGVASFDARSIAVAPDAHRVSIGTLSLEGGKLSLRRDPEGRIDAQSWWRAGRDDVAGPAWQFAAAKLSVAHSELTIEYSSAVDSQFEPLRLTGVAIEGSSFATDSSNPVPVSLSATVAGGGRLQAKGSLVPMTGASTLRLVLEALPLQRVEPWLPADINLALVSGALSGDGELELGFPHGTGPSGSWNGAVAVTDFGVRMKAGAQAEAGAQEEAGVRAGAAVEAGADGVGVPGSRTDPPELLHWESLKLASLKIDLSPFSVLAGDAELDGLRTRLVINPDGRFNLQELGARKSDPPRGGQTAASSEVREPIAPADTPAPSADTLAVPAADGQAPSADSQTARVAPAQTPPEKISASSVQVGRITLTNGEIDFSDYFIQPNYSAHLTAMSGTIGALRAGHPSEIELAGRVQDTGSVEISGKIDPIGAPLFLDIRADAHDIDLPAMSPYSSKYVGYAIKKGKLSASVEYKVEDGHLTAHNQVILDQLSFGDHVESPDALKLPVLFAVSLLKDRNGVIDVNVPISGSLSDPEFSIGGIVMRMIGNLIVKAITAPFSLIAKLVGASETEISSLEFDSGSAALDRDDRKRLSALARALTERPGLDLEIAGRANPADRAALRSSAFDARLKAMKSKASGTPSSKIVVDGAERERLIEEAWLAGRQTSPSGKSLATEKQRPSVEAMQAELLAGTEVPEGALLELASRRAAAARDWLAATGKIAAARLFVTAPGLVERATGGPAPGVEMSLK